MNMLSRTLLNQRIEEVSYLLPYQTAVGPVKDLKEFYHLIPGRWFPL